ncbi:MAG: hypothetical protein ACXVCT_21130, partial [Ktedonobacterales bacterium]
DASEVARDTSSESAASSGTRLAVLVPASLQASLHPSPAPTPTAAVVSATGLPRDAAGRVLLLTTIALAADLLAPWSVVYGQQKTMVASGTSAMALLALFILAALPLMRPDYRARPLYAVAPLAVGAFCLGAGIFYWALLARENASFQPVADTSSSSGAAISSQPIILQPVVVPGFGLYLFLIGGAVLAVVGYQLFLQAALASARATVTPAGQPASPQLSTVPSSASMPLATPIAAPAAASSPLAAVSASESQPASATSSPAVPGRPAGTPVRPIALPGSAAWNEPPMLPTYTRPSRVGNGWSRQAGARR